MFDGLLALEGVVVYFFEDSGVGLLVVDSVLTIFVPAHPRVARRGVLLGRELQVAACAFHQLFFRLKALDADFFHYFVMTFLLLFFGDVLFPNFKEFIEL